MTRPILSDAFGHHHWATIRLIDACLPLTQDQLATVVPGTFGTILDTMRHIVGADAGYLFVLTDEVLRMGRARQSRSAAATGHRSGGSLAWRVRVAGNMVGQLFLRSFERSDRIYNAMLARGYTGQLLTLRPHTMSRRDWAFACAALLGIALLQIIGHWPLG